MPFKTHARQPLGVGQPVFRIQVPTHARHPACSCSFAVVKAGAGMNALSELTYRNALCPVRPELHSVPCGDGCPCLIPPSERRPA